MLRLFFLMYTLAATVLAGSAIVAVLTTILSLVLAVVAALNHIGRFGLGRERRGNLNTLALFHIGIEPHDAAAGENLGRIKGPERLVKLRVDLSHQVVDLVGIHHRLEGTCIHMGVILWQSPA